MPVQKKCVPLQRKRQKRVHNNDPNAKIAQLVEHNLAKVGVAGSSPVFRSKPFTFLYRKQDWEYVRMAELVDALL